VANKRVEESFAFGVIRCAVIYCHLPSASFAALSFAFGVIWLRRHLLSFAARHLPSASFIVIDCKRLTPFPVSPCAFA